MTKNNKQTRMETLMANGHDISNFFDLSLRIPLGATVKLNIDGRELIATGNISNDNVTLANANGINLLQGFACTSELGNDPIAESIMNAGYIFNSRVDGRFVAAQTFRMLNTPSFNYKIRQYEDGWDAYLRNNYPYMYQFKMMKEELHKLAKMERSNDQDFERLSKFFTKEVVYQTCKHYVRQLNKFIKSQPNRKCNGEPYVKLNKYGDVFVKDLKRKIYNPIEHMLNRVNESTNYSTLENSLYMFMKLIPKLPAETPKCSAWKDAFKGKGAYLTLLNIIKFHGVTVQNYETKEMLDRDGSVAYVESLLETYKGEYWKLHELLKATIEKNNFDLRESIKSQNRN